VNKLLTNFYEKLKYFILILIVLLFPVNQQLHIRPFTSVEGVIVDYLILKISIPEILIFALTLFNLNWVVKFFKEKGNQLLKSWLIFAVLILSVSLSIYRSGYTYLAIYENLVLTLLILNSLTLPYFTKINLSSILSTSIKFWMVILVLLGLLQFYFQESIFDSYYYFGEFNYSSDNYHIKQNGFIIKNLIPAYGIFSHSNIYGAFFLICSMFLHLIRKNNVFFTLIAITGVLLSGSLNVLIGLILFFIFFYLKLDYKLLLIYLIFTFILINYLSVNFQKYQEDLSIYRRLYMFQLSNNFFINNPVETISGFGYYNYFKIVSEELYFYEIIRFFQPPHNFFYLLVWNYGLAFVICFVLFLRKVFSLLSNNYKVFYLILFTVSMFDHFLFTNHQLKMLLFLILPYSLNKVFSIKIN